MVGSQFLNKFAVSWAATVGGNHAVNGVIAGTNALQTNLNHI